MGAATIPYKAVKSAINTFGGTIPSSVSFLSSLGIPVPAYTIDARIGGFILPFDIGFKFGYLPSGGLSSFGISGFSADYLMVGGDIRYALMKDSGLSPGLSVGVGYTYMRGNIGVPGVLNGPINIANVSFGGSNHTLGFTNPSLNFFWNTSVIDAKVQLSKNLFIITPYIGLGAAYGISNAGGGMQSAMTVDTIPVYSKPDRPDQQRLQHELHLPEPRLRRVCGRLGTFRPRLRRLVVQYLHSQDRPWG